MAGRRPVPPCVLIAAGALVLSGCAVSAEVPEASPTPDGTLAEKAEIAPRNEATKSKAGKNVPGKARAGEHGKNQRAQHRSNKDRNGKRAGTRSETAGEGASGGGGSALGGGSGGPAETADWRETMAAGDPTGDHGNGPEYADITALTVMDSGDEVLLRVTVAGVLPGQLVTGEVQGVGIDVFRSDDQESDYQVFLDGGTHGWRAFLQTPEGFVKFPGTLSVSGRTLTTVLPWAALGGREDATVSAFADWSSGVGRLSTDGVPRTELSPG